MTLTEFFSHNFLALVLLIGFGSLGIGNYLRDKKAAEIRAKRDADLVEMSKKMSKKLGETLARSEGATPDVKQSTTDDKIDALLAWVNKCIRLGNHRSMLIVDRNSGGADMVMFNNFEKIARVTSFDSGVLTLSAFRPDGTAHLFSYLTTDDNELFSTGYGAISVTSSGSVYNDVDQERTELENLMLPHQAAECIKTRLKNVISVAYADKLGKAQLISKPYGIEVDDVLWYLNDGGTVTLTVKNDEDLGLTSIVLTGFASKGLVHVMR